MTPTAIVAGDGGCLVLHYPEPFALTCTSVVWRERLVGSQMPD